MAREEREEERTTPSATTCRTAEKNYKVEEESRLLIDLAYMLLTGRKKGQIKCLVFRCPRRVVLQQLNACPTLFSKGLERLSGSSGWHPLFERAR